MGSVGWAELVNRRDERWRDDFRVGYDLDAIIRTYQRSTYEVLAPHDDV